MDLLKETNEYYVYFHDSDGNHERKGLILLMMILKEKTLMSEY